jgi:hypothetical protein
MLTPSLGRSVTSGCPGGTNGWYNGPSGGRPWKHPKIGIYWLRKAVPEDLRPLIGEREEKRSLKTRDPAEAKRRHLEALTELGAQWANLRAGPKSLTEREAHDLALTIRDQWLEWYRDDPSKQVLAPGPGR